MLPDPRVVQTPQPYFLRREVSQENASNTYHQKECQVHAIATYWYSQNNSVLRIRTDISKNKF